MLNLRLTIILVGLYLTTGFLCSEGEEVEVEHYEVDKDLMRRYNEIFLEDAEPKQVDELGDNMDCLYRTFTSRKVSPHLRELNDNLFNLIRLRYLSTSYCTGETFDLYDYLLRKYAQGFNKSIFEYVQYHRSRFWKVCKSSLLDVQRADEATSQNDEAESFLLVDHVIANLKSKEDTATWLIDDVESIEPGFISYIREKLGKKAPKKDNIHVILYGRAWPACLSVADRFRHRGDIFEIVRNRPNLRQELDPKSIKWLKAIVVCKVLISQRTELEKRALIVLSREYKQPKMISCIGHLLCIGRT